MAALLCDIGDHRPATGLSPAFLNSASSFEVENEPTVANNFSHNFHISLFRRKWSSPCTMKSSAHRSCGLLSPSSTHTKRKEDTKKKNQSES